MPVQKKFLVWSDPAVNQPGTEPLDQFELYLWLLLILCSCVFLGCPV